MIQKKNTLYNSITNYNYFSPIVYEINVARSKILIPRNFNSILCFEQNIKSARKKKRLQKDIA